MAQDMNLDVKHIVAESTNILSTNFGGGHIYSITIGEDMDNGLIVCRDAVGVRMETGKQAQIINELRSLIESKETIEIKLKEFVGHTPLQVFMGALLGIAVAIVVSIVL
mgnify:CR=1 FL=1